MPPKWHSSQVPAQTVLQVQELREAQAWELRSLKRMSSGAPDQTALLDENWLVCAVNSDWSREATLASAIEGFGVACDGRIAEGCVLYASLAEEEVLANREHPRRAELLATMCEGYRSACHLGEEFDGCNRCRVAGCTGLDGAEPAPIREQVGQP